MNDLGTFAPEIAARVDEERTGRSIGEIGRSHDVYLRCGEGHLYRANVRNLLRGLAPCRECYPRSQREFQLQEFIASIYSGPMVRGDRRLIAPREVDVHLPELKLAMEFNGSYWHSDAQLLKSKGVSALEYHGDKVERCKERGVRLLFIWESEWMSRRDEVEAALKTVVSGGEVNRALLASLVAPEER